MALLICIGRDYGLELVAGHCSVVHIVVPKVKVLLRLFYAVLRALQLRAWNVGRAHVGLHAVEVVEGGRLDGAGRIIWILQR